MFEKNFLRLFLLILVILSASYGKATISSHGDASGNGGISISSNLGGSSGSFSFSFSGLLLSPIKALMSIILHPFSIIRRSMSLVLNFSSPFAFVATVTTAPLRIAHIIISRVAAILAIPGGAIGATLSYPLRLADTILYRVYVMLNNMLNPNALIGSVLSKISAMVTHPFVFLHYIITNPFGLIRNLFGGIHFSFSLTGLGQIISNPIQFVANILNTLQQFFLKIGGPLGAFISMPLQLTNKILMGVQGLIQVIFNSLGGILTNPLQFVTKIIPNIHMVLTSPGLIFSAPINFSIRLLYNIQMQFSRVLGPLGFLVTVPIQIVSRILWGVNNAFAGVFNAVGNLFLNPIQFVKNIFGSFKIILKSPGAIITMPIRLVSNFMLQLQMAFSKIGGPFGAIIALPFSLTNKILYGVQHSLSAVFSGSFFVNLKNIIPNFHMILTSPGMLITAPLKIVASITLNLQQLFLKIGGPFGNIFALPFTLTSKILFGVQNFISGIFNGSFFLNLRHMIPSLHMIIRSPGLLITSPLKIVGSVMINLQLFFSKLGGPFGNILASPFTLTSKILYTMQNLIAGIFNGSFFLNLQHMIPNLHMILTSPSLLITAPIKVVGNFMINLQTFFSKLGPFGNILALPFTLTTKILYQVQNFVSMIFNGSFFVNLQHLVPNFHLILHSPSLLITAPLKIVISFITNLQTSLSKIGGPFGKFLALPFTLANNILWQMKNFLSMVFSGSISVNIKSIISHFTMIFTSPGTVLQNLIQFVYNFLLKMQQAFAHLGMFGNFVTVPIKFLNNVLAKIHVAIPTISGSIKLMLTNPFKFIQGFLPQLRIFISSPGAIISAPLTLTRNILLKIQIWLSSIGGNFGQFLSTPLQVTNQLLLQIKQMIISMFNVGASIVTNPMKFFRSITAHVSFAITSPTAYVKSLVHYIAMSLYTQIQSFKSICPGPINFILKLIMKCYLFLNRSLDNVSLLIRHPFAFMKNFFAQFKIFLKSPLTSLNAFIQSPIAFIKQLLMQLKAFVSVNFQGAISLLTHPVTFLKNFSIQLHLDFSNPLAALTSIINLPISLVKALNMKLQVLFYTSLEPLAKVFPAQIQMVQQMYARLNAMFVATLNGISTLITNPMKFFRNFSLKIDLYLKSPNLFIQNIFSAPLTFVNKFFVGINGAFMGSLQFVAKLFAGPVAYIQKFLHTNFSFVLSIYYSNNIIMNTVRDLVHTVNVFLNVGLVGPIRMVESYILKFFNSFYNTYEKTFNAILDKINTLLKRILALPVTYDKQLHGILKQVWTITVPIYSLALKFLNHVYNVILNEENALQNWIFTRAESSTGLPLCLMNLYKKIATTVACVPEFLND